MSGDLSKDVRKLIMAGIGAVAASGEKSSELLESLAKKGEETFDHGKVLNEELKHSIKQTIKDSVTVEVAPEKVSEFLELLPTLSDSDLELIKAKIQALETKKAADTQSSEETAPASDPNTTTAEGISEDESGI